MRFSSLFPPGDASILPLPQLISLLSLPLARATLFTPVPSPQLDLGPLGRVALTGNFDAISLFTYQQQRDEVLAVYNGSQSQSLIAPLPNGGLAPISSADADILALCSLTSEDGSLTSIVVGGNFTSLGGIESQALALFDPNSGKVSAIQGLSGQVRALLCDSDKVYVGGDFKESNSSNAISWSRRSGFSNLPFGGFNGPVSSIVKAENDHIVFGGSFDGLGNATTPSLKDQQMVNLETAEISSGGSSIRPGFDNPRNAVCQATKRDGPGSTWLLADQQAGYWHAQMRFGYQPTKLRLWNTHFEGRGTRTFRFIALPDTGILNLTYTDPATGNEMACDARCPLSDDPAEEFRDFHFVNLVGMNGFRLEILEFYGQGGGLNGVELLQDDIYVHAVNDFNEPACANIPFASKSTNTGTWTVIPSVQSSSDYLRAQVDSSTRLSTSVTFFPDIKQSGNYSVTIFTPGCIQDGTCATRGIVNVTGKFSMQDENPVQSSIHQTNNFDKYDQIYLGRVDAANANFRPEVTVSAQSGQGAINIVASRVRFQLISSTGGLNGLFDYDPRQNDFNTNFSASAINRAGTELDRGAIVNDLTYKDDTLFVGGNFSNATIHNIMSIRDGRASGLSGDGLNAAVASMVTLDDLVYVGGNFTNLANGSQDKLKHVAAYSIPDDTWLSLGSGVNGYVRSLVRFPVNVSSSRIESAIAVSGDFSQIEESDGRRAIPARGFAVWVPSEKKWLQELEINQMAYVGQLTTSIVAKDDTILAGTLASGGISSHGAVALSDDNGLALQPLPVKIQQTPDSNQRKRALLDKNGAQAVTTGLFDMGSGRNLTVLVGHFTATASDDSTIQNALLIDGSDGDKVTGLGPGITSNSTFLSTAVLRDSLFLGGKVMGQISSSNIAGLVVYDLARREYPASQPGLLEGNNVVVNTIAPRPGSNEVFVGGRFDSAGSLPCPAVCALQTDASQWVRPGSGLQGEVSALTWVSKEKLIAAGNMTVGGNRTTLASYDAKAQSWSSISGRSADLITGPVTALGLARADGSRFWVAGKSPSGSTFLIYNDGTEFHSAGSLFGEQTTIRGVQILSLREEHGDAELIERNQALLLTGQIQLPKFGIVSGAIYNGSTVEPFILSSTSDGKPGSINGLFSENAIKLSGSRQPRSRGIVVLVSFCIALGCIFLIVLIGIILGRIRRRNQGYVRAPQGMDRKPDLRRLPPEYLLDSLRQRSPGVPAI
ncbi:predicted protein [Uncinocarpus reesii 1704]|uniref:Cellular morphogenesis protein n=1 Tax=Uncinocarpus reesii (strain UAMH 1704) TaxID=336963 RepID=C4JJP9_UNCRE|nr:uncharacterized protein UREG_01856 [Uncinocarpus reesii 1704]EEP77007.1 predicted protein [Uncinocarpus reesii 1704]